MIDWIFNNFDKKTISIKKSSAFPSPNFFFLFIITKCACFTIWTCFALKNSKYLFALLLHHFRYRIGGQSFFKNFRNFDHGGGREHFMIFTWDMCRHCKNGPL